MIPAALRSVCAECLHLTYPRRPVLPTLQPCGNLRAASRQARAKPSRMVLSKTVARAPADRDRPKKSNRRQMQGPFGGMNQTTARIPEKKKGQGQGAPSNTYGKVKKEDTRKALKMQRALATISYGKRTSIKSRIQDVDSFDQFDLIPELKEALKSDALKGLVDVKPTPVQRLAIPELLGQGNYKSKQPPKEFLLAAETGSGKTLAYLLPAINAMKLAEAQDTDAQNYQKRWQEERARKNDPTLKPTEVDEPHPTMARPKVVVLVPTAELVEQVGAVAKSLSHMVKFKTERLRANLPVKTIHRNLYSHRGVDVVITTPHLLASIAESDPNVLAQVTHLIVDEADSLLDRSFSGVTIDIIDKARPSLKQFVVCSATIPKRLDAYLGREYPDMMRITTPNLHAIPRRVQLGVVDVSKDPYRNNKNLACADAIYGIGRETAQHEGPDKEHVDVRRVIVFVNERENTEKVKEYLLSKGINAVALHRDITEGQRTEIINMFTSSEPLRIPTPEKPAPGVRTLPNVKVVVATDLASRGIDTLAVRHVILYDIPHTTIDFIHRLGRAGRMGRRGRGIALVGNDDRRDVVKEVKESMFMGQALV